MRAFEIEATLMLLPRGPQRVANVRKLMALADDSATLETFLERVARAEARTREPEAATFAEDDDAVRLLTVHGSKGLAFRVVVIPELKAFASRATSGTLGVDLRSDEPWLATKVLDDRGEPVTTPSFLALTRTERARLSADRRRLLYVAVTRARERLVFVGRPPAKPGTSLADLLVSVAARGLLEVEKQVVTPTKRPREERPVMTLTATRPIRTTEVTLAPTALRDFGHCKRRFELVHLVRLPEPTPRALGGFRSDGNAEVDARAEGDALHALLERVDLDAFGADTSHATARAEVARVLANASLGDEASRRIVASAVRFLTSDYARTVREGATLERERRFVVAVESPALTVTLRGAMDLVVRWPNGDVDVIDYKSARQADLAPHALQLDVYAYALHREASGGRIRSGAVFLGGEGKCAPRFRPAIDVGLLEGRILGLAADMIASRASGRFVRAPAKTCHAIGCGFFFLCHPPTERRQLDLFR